MPDYKATFPQWQGNKLNTKMQDHLSSEGVELLNVRFLANTLR